MRKIIGLMGAKGAGKDTAARFLMDERGYARTGFADALYKEAATAFGLSVAFLNNRSTKETDLPELALAHCNVTPYVECVACHANHGVLTLDYLEQPRSPRFILQYWGTEFRRLGYPGVYEGFNDYWLNLVDTILRESPEVSYVITDVRFPNEYNFVREQGGRVGRIRWPELEAREKVSRGQKGSAAHSSETSLLDHSADIEFFNGDGSLANFREQVLAFDAKLSLVPTP